MIFTPKLAKAIKIASFEHKNQVRKGSKEPYIVHPLSVGIIVSRITKDEDLIISAILHDVLEDGKIKEKEIQNLFGINVLNNIKFVTEDQNPKLSWKEKKDKAISQMKKYNKEACIIKSADMIDNLTDILNSIQKEGINYFDIFNGSAVEKTKRDIKKVKILKKLYCNNPLLPELENIIKQIEDFLTLNEQKIRKTSSSTSK